MIIFGNQILDYIYVKKNTIIKIALNKRKKPNNEVFVRKVGLKVGKLG